jgi:protein phosphatase
MEIAYFTNVGSVRKNNEDAILIQDKIIWNISLNKVYFEYIKNKYIILAVADGMGGHERGEIAAKVTLETLKELKPKNSNELREAILKARDKLEEYKKEYPEALGLGTALAGLIINEDDGIAFNVGDCRVYKKIGKFLRRLTKDHTLAEELVDRGILTEEEVLSFPNRNVLTSAIIGDNYQTNVQIYTKEIKVKDNDIFLICSDGLWETFRGEELEKFFSSDSIKEIAKNIIQGLKGKILRDNVSFVLAKK